MARIFLSLPSKKVRTLYTCIPQTSKKGRRGIEIKQQNIFYQSRYFRKGETQKRSCTKTIYTVISCYICLSLSSRKYSDIYCFKMFTTTTFKTLISIERSTVKWHTRTFNYILLSSCLTLCGYFYFRLITFLPIYFSEP